MDVSSIAVVIPTYNRAEILLDTLQMLFAQSLPAEQIIVVDQTKYLPNDPLLLELQALDAESKMNFIQLSSPTIPGAMNKGLQTATADHVLFLDDDIKIEPDFLLSFQQQITQHDYPAYVGQVLQPGQSPISFTGSDRTSHDLHVDLDFPFNSSSPCEIRNCMAGNLLVKRQAALRAGGFDLNFSGAAYRFETEFCRRMIRVHNRPFLFTPAASIHHLQAQTGGTRSHDHHLTSMSAQHSVGDYYFAQRESSGVALWRYSLSRLLGSLKARFYLSHPWYIPIRLIAEVRGMLAASRLNKQGPRLLGSAVES